MAQYAHNVKRVTFSGTCFGGLEIWSTGLYVGSPNADASNPTQQFADAVRTAWTGFFSGTGARINSDYKTDMVKVAQVGTDGKTHLDNVVYAPYGTALAGGGGGTRFPAQVSLAATLAVSGGRGLASKGRMYLPGVSYALGLDAQITTAEAQTIANAVKTFIDAINAAAPPGESVILASQGRRTKNGDGKYTPVPGTAMNQKVNQIRIGTVYDTQRRRRNALAEKYSTSAIA